MKKLIVLMLALPTVVFAQSYKVKKGILLKDKEPIAKVTGEVGSFKGTDMGLETLDGEVFLHVVGKDFRTDYPGFESVMWFEYEFPTFGLNVINKRIGGNVSEKQFLKFEFENHNIPIYPHGFNREDLDYFVDRDYSQQLHEDTTALLAKISFYQENLKGNSIERDTRVKHTLRVPKDDATGNVFFIAQGKEEAERLMDEPEPIIVGKLIFQKTSTPNSQEPPRTYSIQFYKKLKTPVTIEGKKEWYLIMAEYNLNSNIPKLFLYETGETVFNLSYDKTKTEKVNANLAIEFLIRNGYL